MVCGTDGGVEDEPCGYCGATVRSQLGKGIPFGVPNEERRKREEERRRRAERARLRVWNHTIVGAVIFFALNVISWIMRAVVAVSMVAFSGLLGRAPVGGGGSVWGILLTFLVAVLTAVLVGAPAGYVISKRNAGPLGGALLGAGIFAVGSVLIRLPAIALAARPGLAFICYVLIGGVGGLITGAFIGFHVEADNA